MTIGTKRHRIKLYQLSGKLGAGGQPSTTEAAVDDVWHWADITASKGDEPQQGNQKVALTTHKITMRYLATAKPDMVAVDEDGVRYHVKAALDETGRRVETTLLCTVMERQ